MPYSALVIPADQTKPLTRVSVGEDSLDTLQKLVGGFIEAIPVLDQEANEQGVYYNRVTAYINEDGKFTILDDEGNVLVNKRATQLLKPGLGLFPGDFIAGDMIVCGFNPATGENEDCPADFERYVA